MKTRFQKHCLRIGILLMLMATCVQTYNCAHMGQEWSKADKTAAVVMIAGRTADFASTRYAIDNGCKEMNPLLSNYPDNQELITFAVGTTIIVLALAHILPPDIRRGFLYSLGGVSGAVAIRNYLRARE